MPKYPFLFLLILFSSVLYGQSVVGTVINEETKAPVPFATIRIIDTDDGFVSDVEGHFLVQDYRKGTLRIEISSIGYETKFMSVDFELIKDLILELVPSHYELRELVVSVPGGKLDDVSIVNVEHKSLDFSSLAGSPSLAFALASMPGVDQISTGTGIGKPVIRGLSGSRVVVYTQNIRLENQQFGDEHGLGENAVGISRTEVIKGPASLLYGADALGGVIYLVDENYANRNESEGFIGSQYATNAKTTSSQFGFKTNKEGLKWNVFGAYNSSVDYQLPNKERVANTRFDELAMKSSLGISKKNWVMNLRYGYLVNDFGIPEGNLVTKSRRPKTVPYQHISQHNISLENNLFLGSKEASLVLGYSSNHREEFEEAGSNAELDMLLNTFTYQLKTSVSSSSELLNIIFGIQGMNRENSNNGEGILIPDATTTDFGGYALINAHAGNGWKFQGGMRADLRKLSTIAYSDLSKTIPQIDRNFGSTNFSIGSSYEISKFIFRANASSGFRPPNTAELLSNGVHEGTLRYEIGTPNLKKEKATQTDVSLAYGDEHFKIEVNPFYNKIANYIFLSPTGGTVEGLNSYEYEQSNARLWGGEIGLHFHPHTIHWLHVEADFSSVKAKDDDGIPLPLIPANRLRGKFSAELFLENKDFGGTVFFEFVQKLNQNRIAEEETNSEGYGLINMGMNLDTKSSQWQIGVSNLFNIEYIDHLSRLKSIGIPNSGRNMYLGYNLNF